METKANVARARSGFIVVRDLIVAVGWESRRWNHSLSGVRWVGPVGLSCG